MSAAEIGSTSKWRRMGRLKDKVARPVNQYTLAAGRITPQHKYHTFTII